MKRFVPSSAYRRLLALYRDKRGVSAVEFAIILPVMMVMFFGTVETTQALYSSRKITLAVRTIGDLAARGSTMSTTDGTTIMSAANAVLAPFPSSKAGLVMSGIAISTTGVATVSWSLGRNKAFRACGGAVTLPAAMKPPLGTTGFLVMAEGSMTYTPTIGYVMTGSVTSNETLYMVPRTSSNVAFSGSGNCSSI